MKQLTPLITRIKLDPSAGVKRYLVEAKKGDKAVRFVSVLIVNDGEEYAPPEDADLIANFQKPDGTFCYNAAARERGTNRIMVELTNQALAVAGTLYCEIEVRSADATQVLTSCQFSIEVGENLRNEHAILSSNEMTAFDLKWKSLADDSAVWRQAEELREKNEQARKTAEQQRTTTETAREKNEQARKTAEQQRAVAEQQRVAAEKKREEDTAAALQNQEQLNQTLKTAQQLREQTGTDAAAAAAAAKSADEHDRAAAGHHRLAEEAASKAGQEAAAANQSKTAAEEAAIKAQQAAGLVEFGLRLDTDGSLTLVYTPVETPTK